MRYVTAGDAHGYTIRFEEPTTNWRRDVDELAKKTVHAVPKQTIASMDQAFINTLTVEDVREFKSEYTPRPGDWVCPNAACGANVFASKVACFKCQTPKPVGLAGPAPEPGPVGPAPSRGSGEPAPHARALTRVLLKERLAQDGGGVNPYAGDKPYKRKDPYVRGLEHYLKDKAKFTNTSAQLAEAGDLVRHTGSLPVDCAVLRCDAGASDHNAPPYCCRAVVVHGTGEVTQDVHCNCPDSRYFCKHIVGMLILYIDEPEQFHPELPRKSPGIAGAAVPGAGGSAPRAGGGKKPMPSFMTKKGKGAAKVKGKARRAPSDDDDDGGSAGEMSKGAGSAGPAAKRPKRESSREKPREQQQAPVLVGEIIEYAKKVLQENGYAFDTMTDTWEVAAKPSPYSRKSKSKSSSGQAATPSGKQRKASATHPSDMEAAIPPKAVRLFSCARMRLSRPPSPLRLPRFIVCTYALPLHRREKRGEKRDAREGGGEAVLSPVPHVCSTPRSIVLLYGRWWF